MFWTLHLIGHLSFHHLALFFQLGRNFLSQCTCYIVRGEAFGICQDRDIQVTALWCWVWGGFWEGTMLLARLSAGFESLFPLPTSKLGPSGADSQVGGIVYVLGSCRSFQQILPWGWECLPPLQFPQVFTASFTFPEVLKLYFPVLEPCVPWSVSLPSCSSWFPCTQLLDCPLTRILASRICCSCIIQIHTDYRTPVEEKGWRSHSLKRRSPLSALATLSRGEPPHLPWQAFIVFLGPLHQRRSSFTMQQFVWGSYLLQTKERVSPIHQRRIFAM